MMSTIDFENLWNFLGSWFPDADVEGLDDSQVVRNFLATGNQHEIELVRHQGQRLLSLEALPVEKIALEANRYFEDENACRAWLERIIQALHEVE